MTQIQLIYSSRPFGFDDTTLNSILIRARHHNALNDVTGSLICRDDLYLQLLEGPEAAVTATYDRIRADQRHVDVQLLSSLACAERLFPDWRMRHDPARSWLWTPQQVWAGAARDASTAEARAIFARIAAEPYDGEQPE
jgi:hypothetical protein